MWYVAASSEHDPGIGIGTADSPDGVSWTKSPSNPVLVPGAPGDPDQDGVGSAGVVLDGSTYRMWYTGWKGGEGDAPSSIVNGAAGRGARKRMLIPCPNALRAFDDGE
jgi:hypothetical protein